MTTWIRVLGSESDPPVEIETEEDDTINLEDITAHYPGATTLKYKSGEGIFRSVKCSGGILRPPGGSWAASDHYLVVVPNKDITNKSDKADSFLLESTSNLSFERSGILDVTKRQMWNTLGAQLQKSKEENNLHRMSNSVINSKPRDLIILGISPETTSLQLTEYFEKYGQIEMIQPKKSKDKNVTYAFIRFAEKNTEKKVIEESHEINGKNIQVKVPDSQQGDKELRKLYVCYHEPSLTDIQLKEHFEKYGDISEVYIPKPWRHFCFVTFCEAKVAQSLVGSEQFLNGHSLYIKNQKNLKRNHPEADATSFLSYQPGNNFGEDIKSSSPNFMMQAYNFWNSKGFESKRNSSWMPNINFTEGMNARMNNGMGCIKKSGDSYNIDAIRGNIPPMYAPERNFNNASSYK